MAPPAPLPPAPGPAPVPLEQSKNDVIEATAARLAQMGISKGVPIMTKNAAPGTRGKPVKLMTNVHGLELQKDTIFYAYSVNTYCNITPTKTAVFTKKGKDDYIVLNRHEKCVVIYNAVLAQFDDFFRSKEENVLYYDGQSLLFSLIDLFPGINGKKSRVFEIAGKATAHDDLNGIEVIFMEVYVAERSGRQDGKVILSRENLCQRTADPNLEVNDRSLTQFLEIALNQNCILDTEHHAVFEHGKSYLRKPWEHSFTARDCPEVGDGKRLMVGVKKSVGFIEGPAGRHNNNPALFVDAKKAAFHESINCMEKVQNILNRKQTEKFDNTDIETCTAVMKGITVSSHYTGRKRDHVVQTLTNKTSRTACFDVDGEKIFLIDYFKSKYNINLRCPDAPLLVCKERGALNYYPLELCEVQPMQRVTIPQTTPFQSQKTTKECAIPPLVRQENIEKGLIATKITDPENRFMQAIGLKVYPPLAVNGRQLPGATLGYANNKFAAEAGKWRTRDVKYVDGANCNCWAMYAILDSSRRNQNFDQNKLSKFAQMFYKDARARGINLETPAEVKMIAQSDAKSVMEYGVKNGCQFFFFVTADSITNFHGQMKLFERQLEVVTQDMKLSVALKVVDEGKRLTLENVLNKTNIKLGGTNYIVSSDSINPEHLILGIGLSHPPPAAAFEEDTGKIVPTVVGYASNCYNANSYIGDHIFFSAKRQETLAAMEEIVTTIMGAYMQRAQKPPKALIIYRSGVSEGSYALILQNEIPLIKGTLEKVNAPATKLIFIVVSKEHSVRIFNQRIDPRARATDQNIPSGIVVDTELVHPSYKEFYLNSHTTLQGSALTPRYTILFDDHNSPMDKIEDLTYALTHHHQIVNLATSVPTPLYAANENAKRGRDILTARGIDPNENNLNLNQLTEELAFKNTKIGKVRRNA
ncbi:unnamed protein product [Caenorhabditis auriculariae]|uniref:Piwi domain-containing protein n=1 Tax=Caenorhabditis auriculariae TaxID=2777116 RepID=A0A8S1HV97_9PELO|nr:unnamed protein product [Caenorhabditis auriculariae]